MAVLSRYSKWHKNETPLRFTYLYLLACSALVASAHGIDERAILGVSLPDQIRNVEIRRKISYRHSSSNREAEVAMGGVHSKGWTLGSQGAGMAAPHWCDVVVCERDAPTGLAQVSPGGPQPTP
ncbi:jg17928 [Pararge aegeria aegeria]|uniref:Jg17928 protein n=1 Tax=Pararge aegeria aegeria TaxID=348720 RepID=A0A8S4S350_9NEOP|nr:jg17928 [Pararge aegeria aegeria]